MIYVDTSVILAQIFGEPRTPAPELWEKRLVSSRLLEYEVWTRVHARGLEAGGTARAVLARVSLLELSPAVLSRALEPWPLPVRTLDALHLASLLWLSAHARRVSLLTWDHRMAEVARALGIPLAEA